MDNTSKDFKHFIKHLKLEAITLAILMAALTYRSHYSLWVIPATFLFFDIGMIGYMFNEKRGAKIYNLTHNLSIPTLCISYGVLFNVELMSLLGFVWTFHIAVDRSLGFGLKHTHSFKHTHMGSITRQKK